MHKIATVRVNPMSLSAGLSQCISQVRVKVSDVEARAARFARWVPVSLETSSPHVRGVLLALRHIAHLDTRKPAAHA